MATDKASRKLQDAIANAKGNPAKDPILYFYANTLYVTWEEVREKALLTEETGRFYKAVFGNTPKNRLANRARTTTMRQVITVTTSAGAATTTIGTIT